MLKKLILIVAFVFLMASCSDSSDPTSEPVSAVNVTATQRPENTTASEPEPTDTDEPQPTETTEPTSTPTLEPTDTPEPTATHTPEPTATHTPTSTPEPTLLVIVTDSETGETLEGINVQIIYGEGDATQTLTTDSSGEVLFEFLAGYDSYEISVMADGYGTQTMEETMSLEPTTLEVALEGRVIAEVTVSSVNLRSGPSTAYGVVATAAEGDELQVMGQNDAGTWLVVLLEDGQEAWVSKTVVNLSVDDDLLALVDSPPPPPPTATPAATSTPSATSTPAPTATSEAPAEQEWVTLYYNSNPSEALGTFPVRPFDAQQMYNNMVRMRNSLNTMRDNLGNTLNGDAGACGAYTGAYNSIMNSGVIYDDVPADWEELDLYYVVSFIYSLDRTRPAYLSCVNAGRVDQFNHDLARQAIEDTLQLLNGAINAAAAKL